MNAANTAMPLSTRFAGIRARKADEEQVRPVAKQADDDVVNRGGSGDPSVKVGRDQGAEEESWTR